MQKNNFFCNYDATKRFKNRHKKVRAFRLMSEEEKKLIHGCVAGNSASQKELYLKYGPMIKGICQRYTANTEEANDLFHDTFIFILLNFKNFTHISSLSGWLRRIAINKSIDHYRSQHRYRVDSIDDLKVDIAENNPFLNEIVSMDKIMQFISELPDKYRMAINLYLIEDIDQSKIATLMDETPTNVRTLISRGRQILQKKINRYLNHDDFII